MFSKILIANRGEIACRVIRTAQRLGIRTVAIYSDADAHARHVLMADEAHRAGPAAARESYLQAETVLRIARASGAEAVHPGYGFLSENAAFAEACAQAGIAFIGPPASAIAAMGSKSAAKALMEAAGVPLVPGYHGEDQDPALLAREAERIGFPVLIKASAGGGGKGMRIVERAADFADALASCQREARASFGDDRVLVERYVTRPRHIEVQVFADAHGDCVYLFERDCSVQRRHQKVVEEAPAPGMTETRRREMGEAAVAAARAVGYVGAGTVEFIAEPDGRFFFMEMNTRLQVEHPVTEMVAGLDLVEWQLRVAAGERLPAGQDQLAIHGHSIEARIYAENPETGFLPSIGRVTHMRTPSAVEFETGLVPDPAARPAAGLPARVRVDAGVREGDDITPAYDPMIAKLIVWGPDRERAIRRMRDALAEFEVVGVSTNVTFLKLLMATRSFGAADLDTGLIEREREALFGRAPSIDAEWLATAAAAIVCREQQAARDQDPWSQRNGWRLNGNGARTLTLRFGSERHPVTVEYARNGHTVHAAGDTVCLGSLEMRGAELTGLIGSHRLHARVVFDDESIVVFRGGKERSFVYSPAIAHAGEDMQDEGQLTAPMSGKVIAVMAGKGQKVGKGAPILVMEAMKMEHTIAAPADGTVDEVLYGIGEQVAEGAELVRFSTEQGG